MKVFSGVLTAALLTGSAAMSQEVQSCEYVTQLGNLAEPWEQSIRSFANGQVRVALLDTLEPAAAAMYLAIYSPPWDEVGDRQCRVIAQDGAGFGRIDFHMLEAGYDPATGLTLAMPVGVYVPGQMHFDPNMLYVTVNQSTGEITPQLVPPE